MIIDYKNYKVFDWTDKQLKKQHSKEVLDKYYKQLAFLFQNGYDMNCETLEEVEEQLKMWDWFKTTENFEEMRCLFGKPLELDYNIGKKIVSEELYDIIRNTTFVRKEAVDNPAIMKNYANTYWKKIIENLNRLDDLFYCDDLEIAGCLKELQNVNDIKEKIDFIEEKVDKDIKVLTWLKFVELCNIIYSTYIRLSKVKTDHINISKASNLNDELYGGIGGFDPNTGEIKCIIGSAVWELKTVKTTKSMLKIKAIAGSILKDTLKIKEEDDEGILYLERWYNGKEKDDEKARQVVVCSLIWGIIILLELKHNLNFLDDPRNGKRAEKIRYEIQKIMEYCGIDKDYLL